eukprot:3329419-Alexandrium_andersonii.AAC.1
MGSPRAEGALLDRGARGGAPLPPRSFAGRQRSCAPRYRAHATPPRLHSSAVAARETISAHEAQHCPRRVW